MDLTADELNILGNEIVFIADGLFVIASTTESSSKKAQTEKEKQSLSDCASTFNIIAAWLTLLGDYILLKAAEKEIEEKIQTGESPSELSQLNITTAKAQVIIDAVEVDLAERAAIVPHS